jgi:perosamine synthetase
VTEDREGLEFAAALRVPIVKPALGSEEADLVRESIESGWVVQGPRVAEFERAFADYTGSQYAAAATSCTTALHLAVAILGLKPGDEVIVPAFTWVSTANVVEYMGATPRFCDIDLETFNIDPARIEEVISPKTVGMIPVHLFGLCAEMAPIMEVARSHGLWVVEDAACAFGAWQGGSHAGTFGEIGAFSFHPRKSITTGEGGMLTTANAEVADLARVLRDQGADRGSPGGPGPGGDLLLSDFNHLGYNYRMTDLQGALGCAQMERASWILDQRRRLARRYDGALAELSWLASPTVPRGNVHGYQAYVCLFRDDKGLESIQELHAQRNELMLRLKQRGIATSQGTAAPVTAGYYSRKYGLREEEFAAAVTAERLSIALPLYPDMTDDEQDFVVQELHAAHEGL